jgi:hypothetical protein
MSDYYKKILKLQRANPKAREAVNQWLKENIDPDCDSLQSIVLDEGELIKDFFCDMSLEDEWAEDEDERDDEIHQTKQEIYKQLVPIAELAEPSSTDEIIDDTDCDDERAAYEQEGKDDAYHMPSKTKQFNSPRPDPRLNAIATLLNNNLTEDRVRFIVKDELARILNKAIK